MPPHVSADRVKAGSEAVEVELKFEADGPVPISGLLQVPEVAALVHPVEHQLEAVYFDTADLRLLRNRTTLRRRTGGTDEGWHLKLPRAASERLEVRRPLGRGVRTPPKDLADLVRVHVRDEALIPVARLETRRTVHRLLDAQGNALAEVADDDVSGQSLAPEPAAYDWREIEVELVTGDRLLLDRVGARLLATGCRPATNSSKVQRVLGKRLVPDPTPAELTRKSSAGEVVLAHLREQSGALKTWDPYARQNKPDAVHKMRVASRRLRSALATYRPLLDLEVTEPLRAELKWLGGVLGLARDAEVIHERLTRLLAEQPPDLVLGPVRRRLDLELRQRHRSALNTVRAELNSTRYFRLLDTLDALGDVGLRPDGDAGHHKAAKVLPALVGKARRRVVKAAEQATVAEPGDAQDYQLHEVRKAAKRARYAAESVAPIFGEPATVLAGEMEALQEVLGERQDSAASREVLRDLGVQAHLAGENGFAFGLLHGAELRASDDRALTAIKAIEAKQPKWLR
ncbi:MAG: CYTH and CHAD domain-containing protein [Actinomycetota bacterium]|nr:CYTH and CHAD domain-containing protein [Actinomycetota bacterium]